MIVSCPECKEKVSTEATACPHCGFSVAHTSQKALLRKRRPVIPHVKSQHGTLVVVFLFAGSVIGIGVWIVLRNQEQQRERQETIEAVERIKVEQRALRARAQAQDDALEREREEKRRVEKGKLDQEEQDMIDDVNALKAGIDPSQCSYCSGSGRFLSNAG